MGNMTQDLANLICNLDTCLVSLLLKTEKYGIQASYFALFCSGADYEGKVYCQNKQFSESAGQESN